MDINKFIFRINTPQSYIIRLYSLKLILQKYRKWEDFEKLIREKDNLFEFQKYFSKEINFGNNEVYLLQSNNINKEEYFENIKILFEYKLNKENNNKFDNFLKVNNYEFLYIFLANIFIISHYYGNEKVNIDINDEKEKDKLKNFFDDLIISLNEYMNKQNVDNDIILFINTLFTKQIFNDKIMPKLGINEKEKNKDMEIKKVKIL